MCHLAKRALGVAVWTPWGCDDRYRLLTPLLRRLRLTGSRARAVKTDQKGKNELTVAVFEQEVPLANSCISSARDVRRRVAMELVAADAPLATGSGREAGYPSTAVAKKPLLRPLHS